MIDLERQLRGSGCLDRRLRILEGDCRAVLPTLPAESVQCCVTSPPYWGLRDYGTAQWDGGDEECDHQWAAPSQEPEEAKIRAKRYKLEGRSTGQHGGWEGRAWRSDGSYECKCGARRIDSQLGLEATPEEYIVKMVAVFREVWRVLRLDGTLWVNMGDSYANDTKWGGQSGGLNLGSFNGNDILRKKKLTGLKPKDLCGIPWRLAFALQADGWYLRSDIIWHKPNPLPESVTDRPTKAHEYIFLLTKQERYFYDAEAIREPDALSDHIRFNDLGPKDTSNGFLPAHNGLRTANGRNGQGRNKRSVWTIATQPYSEAHFATFPEEIPKLCILAGSKPGDTILDPFAGSGTVGQVALELGRQAVLIELNPAYIELAHERTNVTPGWF